MSLREPICCPRCEAVMNRHAEKLDQTAVEKPETFDPQLGGTLEEFSTCTGCSFVLRRLAQASQ